jgi:ribose transport system permease protein
VVPLVCLTALVVFFAFASRHFLRPTTLVLILQQASVLAVVATGLTFVVIAAEIDLSVGMLALWAGTSCGWLFERWIFYREAPLLGTPATLVAVITIPLLACLACGLVSGLLTLSSRLPSFLITLAMMFVAEGAAMWLTNNRTFRIPEVLKLLDRGGLRFGNLPVLSYSVILAGLVLLAGHLVLRSTRFGRSVYLVGSNREAARLTGMRTGRVVVACLMVSALAAGLGGLMHAGRHQTLTLDQNHDLLLGAMASVVLGGTSLRGGKGSIANTLVGVLLFTLLNLGLDQVHWLRTAARPMLNGIVLLAALLLNGLLDTKRGS